MKKSMFLLLVFGAILLSGCSFNSTTEDKLSNLLEELLDTEKTYHDRQSELKELEQAEQTLFNETMELTQEDRSKVMGNLAELKEMLEERTVKMEEEAESMREANAFVAEFDKVEEAANATEKAEIESLKQAIHHRYELHKVFVEAYQELTILQKELYDMLLNEETDTTKLDKHVERLNAQNHEVMRTVESFNEATIELNQTREELYEGLKNE